MIYCIPCDRLCGNLCFTILDIEDEQVAGYDLRVASCGLRVTSYELRVVGYELRVTGFVPILFMHY
jgi:hypothetical protein